MLYVALRAVDSLKVIFTPFLPHTSQTLHELLGYDGWLAGPLEFRAVSEEDGRTHEVLTGDYASWIGLLAAERAARRASALREPVPLFRKLDATIGEDELGRAMIDTHAHLEPAEAAEALVARAGGRRRPGPRRRDDGRGGAGAPSRSPTRIDGVYAILGIHPHNAAERRRRGPRASCASSSAQARAVAVGETGLDYFRDYAPREAQQRLFAAQLELAAELGMPVVIHTRAADDDTLAALAGFDGHRRPPLLLLAARCSSRRSSAAGTSRSPATSPTRRRPSCAPRPRLVPADRILAETDSPYLAPQPVRGQRNEPANVVHTLAALAEARGEDAAELGRQIDANATAGFGL